MTDEAQTGQDIERGAAEDAAGTPLTQTEIDASRRPPSAPGNRPETGTDDDSTGPQGRPASTE